MMTINPTNTLETAVVDGICLNDLRALAAPARVAAFLWRGCDGDEPARGWRVAVQVEGEITGRLVDWYVGGPECEDLQAARREIAEFNAAHGIGEDEADRICLTAAYAHAGKLGR